MDQDDKAAGTDRRAFLATAGKFAVITPPAMTILLSTSLSSPAIAASGVGSYGGNNNNNNNNNDNDHHDDDHHHH